MKPVPAYELPENRRPMLRRAVWLEVLTVAFLLSVIGALASVYGGSQVVKADIVEAGLSLLAPLAFLVALPFRERPPTERFPYGFHRVIVIAFLVAAVGLTAVGAYLFVDSAISLASGHRPTIGAVTLFGRTFWRGWLILPIFAYSAIPPVLLGRAKMGPARRLHDKVLHADAEMNSADWKTGIAAILGLSGIAFGFWWADSAAALLIAMDVLYDGFRNLRAGVFDLMDRQPQRVDESASEALPARVATELEKLDWVRGARVRLRESGHVFYGEAFIAPVDDRDPIARLDEARQRLDGLDWRLQEVVLQLDPGGAEEAGKS